MADDLAFTFDTDLFTNGIKKITRGMDSMQTSATTVARGISKGFNVVIAKLAVIKGAFMSIKSSLNQMPEVGKAFGIAKNVFLKNLLYPLRKEIMPLLQKMMDWVRDNRTLFVKWGQTIANVFRSAISGFKTLLGWARSITKTLFGFINDMFGTTIKSFDDLLNIVSFKIALVVEFLKLLARPIMDALGPLTDMLKNTLLVVLEGVVSLFGKIARFVVEIGTSFTEGFVKGITGIEGPLKKIFDAMGGIVDLLFTGEGPLKFWKDVFEGLGYVIGTTIKLAFEGIAIVLETIEIVIQKIKDFFTSDDFGKFIDNTVRLFDAVGKNIVIGAEAQQASGVPSGGRAIMAAFGPGNTDNRKLETYLDLSNMNINITDSTGEVNPYDLGPKIGETILNFFREQYDKEFTRGGE